MYLRQNNDPLEYLLYDFDLTIGDTLPLTFNNFSADITVTGIDSFSTPYGYRKIFTLAGSTWSQFLIEGVGHSSGFLEPVNIGFDCGFNLFCYALNDTSYYPSSGLNCDVFSSINEIENPLPYLIYPNPFISSTLIEIKNRRAPTLVSVTNNLGEIIKLAYTDDEGRLTLYNDGMAAGVYFVSVLQGDKIENRQNSYY
ncbi:MAG: T9SS type A sorting domain-containing protein [Bacteroidetes bacterium]|nr:T9SS type A sorting domain-containing protein [Bacteroidota bacterium]